MASPGNKKGQRRGLCGHIMASFDLHKRCARCHDKKMGDDDCVENRPCAICDGFTDIQKEMLSTPTYKLRKEIKSGLLVSPEDVTILATVEDKEPIFHSTATPPPPSSTSAQNQWETSSSAFVTSAQFKEISGQWSEQFARFEALLSGENVFSTQKTDVKPIPSYMVVSDTPFITPSARLTGPVGFPAEGEAGSVVAKPKDKKKSRKSRKENKDTKARSSFPSVEKIRKQKEHTHRLSLSHWLLPKSPPVQVKTKHTSGFSDCFCYQCLQMPTRTRQCGI